MHFFSINQKIWHFFVKISQYFKDRFCGGAAFYAAELRYLSTSGRFMHLWCVSCGEAAGFCCVVRPRAGCCTSRTSSTRGGGAAGFSRTEPRELNQWRANSLYGITRIVFGITNKERTRCSVSIPRMIILQSIHPLSR